MPYPSVDELQKTLADSVFAYTADKKKAAGRALGTLVEIITFYLLRSWGLHRFLAIERPLPEYSNDEISHNVEYSLHPSTFVASLQFGSETKPLSVAKIAKQLSGKGVSIERASRKTHQLLSSGLILRNGCTVADEGDSFLLAILQDTAAEGWTVSVNRLLRRPFAIAECKRVGIEEGTKKGPQTIEKAKQGAYVARAVSSLQKVRLPTGEAGALFIRTNGDVICRPYQEFMHEIIEGDDPEFLRQFVLTIGVVSNHGNWFTSDDHNKELKVLAQSYDWLLFLTDEGLAEFIQDLLLKPPSDYVPVREAFLASYTGKSGRNCFTKVRMTLAADRLLMRYSEENLAKIQSWFNVIAPPGKPLALLPEELQGLAGKDWAEVHT